MDHHKRQCYICCSAIRHNFRTRHSVEESLQTLNLWSIPDNIRYQPADFCPPCRSKLDAAAEIVTQFRQANQRRIDAIGCVVKPELRVGVHRSIEADSTSDLKPIKLEEELNHQASIQSTFQDTTAQLNSSPVAYVCHYCSKKFKGKFCKL